jgi:hypothetical protein
MIYDFVETNSSMFAYIKRCTGKGSLDHTPHSVHSEHYGAQTHTRVVEFGGIERVGGPFVMHIVNTHILIMHHPDSTEINTAVRFA